MRTTRSFIIITGLLLAFGAYAENNNDPSVDINSTSIGTRMNNAWTPTMATAGISTSTGIGPRLANAGSGTQQWAGMDMNSSIGTRLRNSMTWTHQQAGVAMNTGIDPRLENAGAGTNLQANMNTNSSIGTRMANAGATEYNTYAVDRTSNHEWDDSATPVDNTPALNRAATLDETTTTTTSEAPLYVPTYEESIPATIVVPGELTAADQSNTPTDLQMTRRIRQDLMKSSLSMGAKNVQIITNNGFVTLKGELSRADEKQAVEEMAKAVAGQWNVSDDIQLK